MCSKDRENYRKNDWWILREERKRRRRVVRKILKCRKRYDILKRQQSREKTACVGA